jgi:Spy/CpxP family protein refolding chaperone
LKVVIMNRRAFVSSVAVGVALAAAVAFAGRAEGRPPGPPPDVRLENHLEKLGLTSAQMEKVRVILDGAKQKRQQNRAQLRAAFDQMHSLLEQDTPDEAAIMQQADKIGQLQTEGHKAMLHTLLQVRAELTPEQRHKLQEMKDREGPHWHRRGKNAE